MSTGQEMPCGSAISTACEGRTVPMTETGLSGLTMSGVDMVGCLLTVGIAAGA